jgi:multidrug transporter EmrE-like cation transporter
MLLFIAIFLGASGQILLKYATERMGEINLEWSAIPFTLLNIFRSPWIITGICFFVASMILWIKVISTMELSKAYPSISLSYIIVFVFSVLLFKETVTLTKVIGMVLVSIGVFFLQQ